MNDFEDRLKKGIKVWIGFSNGEAYDFSYEKGIVFLIRRQCPFDDARPFILKPFKSKKIRSGGGK